HNKTRRRFLPNIQTVSLMSEVLGRTVKLRLAASTLRTIEHKGGLDAFLMDTGNSKLTVEAVKIKKQIKNAQVASPA
ncbi:MAG TPA: 50S ribosomal protein L28, partial [Alphaproteobacteria bacterium]|nr:50S ribosomal protein L28 [Alphaproteobacteria bacterium]